MSLARLPSFVPSILLGERFSNSVLAYPTSCLCSAQMITSAITVASNGNTVLGAGATYGILLAILFFHGVVCSAATNVLARLNLFYVVVNGIAQVS